MNGQWGDHGYSAHSYAKVPQNVNGQWEDQGYNAHSYAKFLVDICPEDAVAILSNPKICNPNSLENQVDLCCIRLGGHPLKTKAMVQAREFEKLKRLKCGDYNYLP